MDMVHNNIELLTKQRTLSHFFDLKTFQTGWLPAEAPAEALPEPLEMLDPLPDPLPVVLLLLQKLDGQSPTHPEKFGFGQCHLQTRGFTKQLSYVLL